MRKMLGGFLFLWLSTVQVMAFDEAICQYYKSSECELMDAIRRKDRATVSQLLEQKADVNHYSPVGRTPLMVAVDETYLSKDVIQLLLERQADPNAQKRKVEGCFGGACPGSTALHILCGQDLTEEQQVEFIKLFQQYGASNDIENQNGKRPSDQGSLGILYPKARMLLLLGRTKVFDKRVRNALNDEEGQVYKQLLDGFLNPLDFNLSFRDWTLLHIAARHDAVDVVTVITDSLLQYVRGKIKQDRYGHISKAIFCWDQPNKDGKLPEELTDNSIVQNLIQSTRTRVASLIRSAKIGSNPEQSAANIEASADRDYSAA